MSALLPTVSCLLNFNTSETDEIENEKHSGLKYLDKNAAPFCKTCCLGMRNGTLCVAIWSVSQGKAARFADCFRAENTVFGWFSAYIRVWFIAHFSQISHKSHGSQLVKIARPFPRYLQPRNAFPGKRDSQRASHGGN